MSAHSSFYYLDACCARCARQLRFFNSVNLKCKHNYCPSCYAQNVSEGSECFACYNDKAELALELVRDIRRCVGEHPSENAKTGMEERLARAIVDFDNAFKLHKRLQDPKYRKSLYHYRKTDEVLRERRMAPPYTMGEQYLAGCSEKLHDIPFYHVPLSKVLDHEPWLAIKKRSEDSNGNVTRNYSFEKEISRQTKSERYDEVGSVSMVELEGKGKMKTFDNRLETFEPWPHRLPNAFELVSNGFYFAPRFVGDDRVRCYSCATFIYDWGPEHVVSKEHVRHAPDCARAKLPKILDSMTLV